MLLDEHCKGVLLDHIYNIYKSNTSKHTLPSEEVTDFVKYCAVLLMWFSLVFNLRYLLLAAMISQLKDNC